MSLRQRYQEAVTLALWVLVAVVGVIVAAGFISGAALSGGAREPGPTPTTTVRSVTPDESAYLNDLDAIDPRLARDPSRAIIHGRNVCLDTSRANPEVINHVIAREGVSLREATVIADIAVDHLCPQYRH